MGGDRQDNTLRLGNANAVVQSGEDVRRIGGQPQRSDLVCEGSGLEGLVAKRRDILYEAGERSGAWQMRINKGQEFVIGGYTVAGAFFDALVFGYYDGGRLIYVARTPDGFTPKSGRSSCAGLNHCESPECPFANLQGKKPGRWRAGLTAEKMRVCR
jgi:hypothetical protein